MGNSLLGFVIPARHAASRSFQLIFSTSWNASIVEGIGQGSDPATQTPIWTGGAAIKTPWQAGDFVSSTSDYWSSSLGDACASLAESLTVVSAVWHADTELCNVTYTNKPAETLDPGQLCAKLSMGFETINPHSHRCEYASDAKDTLVLALEHWEKVDTRCIVMPPAMTTVCFDAAVPPVLMGFDDDSGAGRNFRVSMPSASIGGPTSSPAFMVGLYPFVTELDRDAGPDYEEMVDGPCEQFRKRNDEKGWSNAAPASFYILGANRTCPSSSTSLLGITRDWIRVYRDNYRARSGGAWNDPDYDGLSSALEAILGTNPNRGTTEGADSDKDGIMDGLEVYGPIWDVRDWTSTERYSSLGIARSYLPLPYYGASPTQKNIVIEVDRQQTNEATV
jgi:hypothetical protein